MIKVARGSFTQELVGRTIKLGVTSEAGCVTRYFRTDADHTVDVTVLKQFGYAAVESVGVHILMHDIAQYHRRCAVGGHASSHKVQCRVQ